MPGGMWLRSLSLVFLMALLTACVAPPKLAPSEQPQWSGRLSIKVERDPVQQTSAGFTLMGDALAGQLNLFTPLGGKAAEVVWGRDFATISDGKMGRNFPDLATALYQVTGADIPVSNLFDWLQGKQDKARDRAMGWEADLARLSEGRIVAIRLQPLPRIELRVVLEQ
jgi:outer membrane lipoprotein LolB